MNGELASSSTPESIRAIVAHTDLAKQRAVKDVLAGAPDIVVAAAAQDVAADVEVTLFRRAQRLLSSVEWDVLDLLCDGLPTRAIESSLALSEGTVDDRLKIVLEKLGVKSSVQAPARAQSS
jgi:DNA-binding NarL/FixJ family response regulator